MRNIRIYLDKNFSDNSNEISLNKEQFNYIFNVMRCKKDQKIKIFNEQYGEWIATIKSNKKNSINLITEKKLREKIKNTQKKLIIAIALLKKSKMELIIQKATELGVDTIIPIITDRCVAKQINKERLNNIAIESSEQCNRMTIPLIQDISKLEDLQKFNNLHYNVAVCNEKLVNSSIKDTFNSLDKTKNTLIIIGPEGGFSESEVNFFDNNNNILQISLGKFILRAETAAISALSIYNAICTT